MNLEKLTKFSMEIMKELFEINPSEVSRRPKQVSLKMIDQFCSFISSKISQGDGIQNFITDEVVVSCEIGPDCPFDYMCNVDDMKTGKAETGFCQVRLHLDFKCSDWSRSPPNHYEPQYRFSLVNGFQQMQNAMQLVFTPTKVFQIVSKNVQALLLLLL